MRDNPVKQRLAAGGRAFGAMIFEFFTPGMPGIAAAAGADFILFDMEHSGAGFDTIKAQIAACRGLDIVPMVRVPTLQGHFISRSLDVGALGIMVPMVDTADQARAIVAATRYPPEGRRGAAFGMAHDDYRAGAVADTMAAGNARTFVIAQIETVEGLRNVDAIAAVEGVDCVWLGHFDLTNFMGIPGQFQHPDYLAGIEAIVAAARRHGKTAGVLAADPAWGRDYLAKGFRAMVYGLDAAVFRDALAQGIAAIKDAAPS